MISSEPRARRPAAARLIATIGLMDAAVNRWPFDVIRHVPFATTAILYAMIVSVAVFDWWSLRRIHRVTIIGGVFLALALLAAIPVGMTSAWQHVAALAAHAWRGGA